MMDEQEMDSDGGSKRENTESPESDHIPFKKAKFSWQVKSSDKKTLSGEGSSSNVTACSNDVISGQGDLDSHSVEVHADTNINMSIENKTLENIHVYDERADNQKTDKAENSVDGETKELSDDVDDIDLEDESAGSDRQNASGAHVYNSYEQYQHCNMQYDDEVGDGDSSSSSGCHGDDGEASWSDYTSSSSSSTRMNFLESFEPGDTFEPNTNLIEENPMAKMTKEERRELREKRRKLREEQEEKRKQENEILRKRKRPRIIYASEVVTETDIHPAIDSENEMFEPDPICVRDFMLNDSDHSNNSSLTSDTSLTEFEDFYCESKKRKKKKKRGFTEKQKAYNRSIHALQLPIDIDEDFTQRWQRMHRAKGVIDNAINASLEDMGLSPHPDSLYKSMENAGVNQRLDNHGMTEQPPSPPVEESWEEGHLRRMLPITNRLTTATEVLFVYGLQKQRMTLLMNEERRLACESKLHSPLHEDDVVPLAAFCRGADYFDNSTAHVPNLGRGYWQRVRRSRTLNNTAQYTFKSRIEQKIRRQKKIIKRAREKKLKEWELRRQKRLERESAQVRINELKLIQNKGDKMQDESGRMKADQDDNITDHTIAVASESKAESGASVESKTPEVDNEQCSTSTGEQCSTSTGEQCSTSTGGPTHSGMPNTQGTGNRKKKKKRKKERYMCSIM